MRNGKHEFGRESHQVRLDFLKADLDAAFALLREAGKEYSAGDPGGARRVLDETRRVYRDVWHLLGDLNPQEWADFSPRLEELQETIEQMDRLMGNAQFRVSMVYS